MAVFKYTALDKAGKKRKGSLEAVSMDTAKSSLRRTGYTILDIYRPGVMEKDIQLPFLGNPEAKDMAVFCRQVVSILHAGMPLTQVLAMLARQTRNAKLAAVVSQMRADIEKGDTFASAMSRHPRIFPEIMVSMVKAGEESGNLEEVFRQLEIYFDKRRSNGAAVSKAMTYPIVLVVAMLIVLVIMMTKIIPVFMRTFTEMDMELPAVTLAVVSVSEFFIAWWWLLAAGVAALVIFVVLFRRSRKGRRLFDRMALKLPAVKGFAVRSACAVFCRTMAVLLGSGLSLMESLELAGDNMSNVYFRETVREIAGKLAQGRRFSAAIEETGLFPPMVCNLVAIGEESGDIRGMMEKAAGYYDDEVAESTHKLLNLLEPLLLVFLAVFVAILVIAVFLPMMSMTRAYDGYL